MTPKSTPPHQATKGLHYVLEVDYINIMFVRVTVRIRINIHIINTSQVYIYYTTFTMLI